MRISGLGHPIFEDRPVRALGPAFQMKDFAARLLGGYDLFLQDDESFEERLGTRRTPRNVHIDRNDLVNPLHDAVDVIHPARIRARTHGDHPLGLRHLFVEAQHDGGNFFEDGPGNYEKVRLPGGSPQHFRTEPGQVVSGGKGGRFLDKAAGKPEEHRPEAVFARPVDHNVREIQKPAGRLCLYATLQSSPPCFQI